MSLSLEGPVLSSLSPLSYCLLPLPGELVLSFFVVVFSQGEGGERGGPLRFCPKGRIQWYEGQNQGRQRDTFSKVE